jgi:imidazolonepropionase-like amidohydrolase
MFLAGGLLAISLVVAASMLVTAQAAAGRVTVYEGATLIVGDGSAAIENAAHRRRRAFRGAEPGSDPQGAARTTCAASLVMPAIIDTHTHLAIDSRDAHHHIRKAFTV